MPTRERNQAAVEKGHQIAVDAFTAAARRCASDDELSGLFQMLCILGAKAMHGHDGRKFKRDFLKAAMADNESIKPLPEARLQ